MVEVFFYWDRGVSHMPHMIRHIYEHNMRMAKLYVFDMVLLTDANLDQYIQPGTLHPLFSTLASNHKSDIIRFNVLHQRGGIWLDTDVIIVRDMNILYRHTDPTHTQVVLDMETPYREHIGCASLVMRPNTICSQFCVDYVNKVLDANAGAPLIWGCIGPDTVRILYQTHASLIRLNTYTDVTSKGCNFIDWTDDPGVHRNKWYFADPLLAQEVAHTILAREDCFYVITWTIYRKHTIPGGDLVDFVFDQPHSVFYYLVRPCVPSDVESDSSPSFHVLIATAGTRPSIQCMLDSLSPQLTAADALTIVYDGKTDTNIDIRVDVSAFQCTVYQHYEPTALGHWGHGIRNKYASLLSPRDFVMHADDDDVYTPYLFDWLRRQCTISKPTLRYHEGRLHPLRSRGATLGLNTIYVMTTVWQDNQGELYRMPKSDIEVSNLGSNRGIVKGQIGTPSGIIPFALNTMATWGYVYGGDGDFYLQLQDLPNVTIEFLHCIGYVVRPNNLRASFSRSKDSPVSVPCDTKATPVPLTLPPWFSQAISDVSIRDFHSYSMKSTDDMISIIRQLYYEVGHTNAQGKGTKDAQGQGTKVHTCELVDDVEAPLGSNTILAIKHQKPVLLDRWSNRISTLQDVAEANPATVLSGLQIIEEYPASHPVNVVLLDRWRNRISTIHNVVAVSEPVNIQQPVLPKQTPYAAAPKNMMQGIVVSAESVKKMQHFQSIVSKRRETILHHVQIVNTKKTPYNTSSSSHPLYVQRAILPDPSQKRPHPLTIHRDQIT